VQLAELKAFPFGFDLYEALSVVDRGDCLIDPHHPASVAPAIEAAAAEVIASGAKLLALGGDHFVAWPLLRAHAAKHRSVRNMTKRNVQPNIDSPSRHIRSSVKLTDFTLTSGPLM
jgi:arginase family enzyme